MNRRSFISVGVVTATVIALSSSLAVGFGIKVPGLGGGGGGGWGPIAKDLKASLVVIAEQNPIMLDALGDLAAAAGFKEEAALLKKKANDCKNKSCTSADEFEKTGEMSASTINLIKEKLSASKSLTADQKEKMAIALAKYAPAAIKGFVGAVKFAAAASKAGGAGTPGMSDGMEVVNLAKDLPTLAPAAASWVSNTVEATNKLYSVAQDAGIPAPQQVDMSSM
jgi:LysM repeat protein